MWSRSPGADGAFPDDDDVRPGQWDIVCAVKADPRTGGRARSRSPCGRRQHPAGGVSTRTCGGGHDGLMAFGRRRTRGAPSGTAQAVGGTDGQGPDRVAPELWDDLAAVPPPGLPDLGGAILDAFAADLQTDEEWIVRGDRSLTWWGTTVPTRVTVSNPRLCRGDPTIKITAVSTLLKDVSADPNTVLAVLARENRRSTTGALVWLADDRRVVSFVTQYAYEGNEPQTSLFTVLSLLAYTDAIDTGPGLAAELGAVPAFVEHPTSGFREDADEMMTFAETTVIPRGQDSNDWSGSELAHLPVTFADAGVVASGDEDGLAAEFVLTGDGWSHDAEAPATALLQLLRGPDHPTYGTGLLALLRLPGHPGNHDSAWLANELNLSELGALTGFPSWGAWCVGPDETTLTHTAFLPNLLARPGVLSNVSLFEGPRTRWAAMVLDSQT
jgi:hypothetical protein